MTQSEYERKYEAIRQEYEEAIRPHREIMNDKLEALCREYAGSKR